MSGEKQRQIRSVCGGVSVLTRDWLGYVAYCGIGPMYDEKEKSRDSGDGVGA